jgi:hypothetical protein
MTAINPARWSARATRYFLTMPFIIVLGENRIGIFGATAGFLRAEIRNNGPGRKSISGPIEASSNIFLPDLSQRLGICVFRAAALVNRGGVVL